MTATAEARIKSWGPLVVAILASASGWAAFYVKAQAADAMSPLATRVVRLEARIDATDRSIDRMDATLIRIESKLDAAIQAGQVVRR